MLAKLYQLAQCSPENVQSTKKAAWLWKQKNRTFIRMYKTDKARDCYRPESGKALSKGISTENS